MIIVLLSRVIIQNERFTTDDWKRELGRMQYEILQFENNIYSYLRNTYPLINKNSNKTKLNICTAMDANLLEVLNMAINRRFPVVNMIDIYL